MISMSKWAQRFDPTPHANTLRNWARNGQIVPPPVKIGRAYYVNEKARHINEIIQESHGATIPLT